MSDRFLRNTRGILGAVEDVLLAPTEVSETTSGNGHRLFTETLGVRLYRVAAALFLCATALLVLRVSIILDIGSEFIVAKPSDPLVLITALVAASATVLSRTVRARLRQNRLLVQWVKYLALFLACFIVGSIWSSLSLGRLPTASGVDQYVRIAILGFGFFLLTLAFGYKNRAYVKILAFTFFTSFAIVPVLIIPEHVAITNYLVSSLGNHTLTAFHSNNLILGSYLAFPAVLAFSFFVVQQKGAKFTWFLGMVLLTSLVLWSGSRGAWMAVGVAYAAVVAARYWSVKNERELAWNVCALGLIAVLALFILPQLARVTVLDRIWNGPQSGIALRDMTAAEYLSTNELRFDVDFRNSRGLLWQEHAVESFFHPFGLGPSYVSILREESTDRFSKTLTFRLGAGAHNTWLQVLLSAGFVGFVLFGLGIVKIAKDLSAFLVFDRTVFRLVALGGFVAVIVNSFFIDSLELRWFWVILALVVVFCENGKRASEVERW